MLLKCTRYLECTQSLPATLAGPAAAVHCHVSRCIILLAQNTNRHLWRKAVWLCLNGSMLPECAQFFEFRTRLCDVVAFVMCWCYEISDLQLSYPVLTGASQGNCHEQCQSNVTLAQEAQKTSMNLKSASFTQMAQQHHHESLSQNF